MPISVTCSGCDTTFKVKETQAGKRVRCTSCGEAIRVPAEEEPEDEEQEEEEKPARGKNKRGREEEEEDEKPRKKKPAREEEEDEEEERPRKKKARSEDEEEEEDEKPQKKGADKGSRKKKAKKGGSGLLILGLVGGGLLLLLVLVGGGLAIYFATSGGGGSGVGGGGGGSGGGGNAAISKENLGKFTAGMPKTEVEKLLGSGSSATMQEVEKVCTDIGPAIAGDLRRNAPLVGVKSWVAYRNGPGGLYIGYAPSSSGERVAYSFWARKSGKEVDFLMGALAVGGVDQAGAKADKDRKILDDPRWAKGDDVRKLVVGQWRKSDHGYDFEASGTMKSVGAFGYSSAYRFRDDRHIEVEVPNPINPGQKTRAVYRVLVDANSLYMVEIDGSNTILNGPYQRSKKKGK